MYVRNVWPSTFPHKLVHTNAIIRDVIGIAQSRQQVIGVEHGVVGDGAQPLRAVHGGVSEGAHEHTEMAVEGFHSPDRPGWSDKAIKRREILLFVAFFEDA